MFIINKSARLIDFSFDKEKYRLMPAGDPVEVPQKAMNSAFLKALIDNGDVSETTKNPKESAPETKSEDEPVETKDKKKGK